MIIPPEHAEEIRRISQEYRKQQEALRESIYCRYCSEELRWCRCHERDPI